MSWKIIRPQVKEVLDSISEISEVSQAPKIKFDSYPAAHITPSENSGDYETNRENIRVYAFTVRCFYSTKGVSIENALLGLEEVVDAVIDEFDQEDLRGSDTRKVGMNLPANYTFINLWATPSRWGELPEDQLIMAEITVRVRVSVDVT
jgi:hypothetical protein